MLQTFIRGFLPRICVFCSSIHSERISCGFVCLVYLGLFINGYRLLPLPYGTKLHLIEFVCVNN